jgi:hypothetical protein
VLTLNLTKSLWNYWAVTCSIQTANHSTKFEKQEGGGKELVFNVFKCRVSGSDIL